jgi:hypothetical protein
MNERGGTTAAGSAVPDPPFDGETRQHEQMVTPQRKE